MFRVGVTTVTCEAAPGTRLFGDFTKNKNKNHPDTRFPLGLSQGGARHSSVPNL